MTGVTKRVERAAHLDQRESAVADSLFPVESLTKLGTALAILRLVNYRSTMSWPRTPMLGSVMMML